MIDLKNLDKTKVLIALYNNAKALGMGFLHYTSADMTENEAKELLNRQTYFDYVHGRVMKVDLSGDTLNPALYDRDNGQGAAFAAINTINS